MTRTNLQLGLEIAKQSATAQCSDIAKLAEGRAGKLAPRLTRMVMTAWSERRQRLCCTDGILLHGSAVVAGQGSIGAGWNLANVRKPAVPFKHHAEHRHHIAKPRYRVTNGSEYDVALRRGQSDSVVHGRGDRGVAGGTSDPSSDP